MRKSLIFHLSTVAIILYELLLLLTLSKYKYYSHPNQLINNGLFISCDLIFGGVDHLYGFNDLLYGVNDLVFGL